MAATHEVASDALPYSGQEYEQFSVSKSDFVALVSKLRYLHTKDQFKWFENFVNLKLCYMKCM